MGKDAENAAFFKRQKELCEKYNVDFEQAKNSKFRNNAAITETQ